MPIPRPVSGVVLETPEQQVLESEQLRMLKQKLEEIGIAGDACKPGQYYGLTCPSCKGGDSEEKSLSLHITKDGAAAMWTCFRAKCGWRGTTRAFADVKSTYAKMSRIAKAKQPFREITEESLELEPLCNELLAYFAERMIFGETLRRNSVMQKRRGNQIAIAFTYRGNGELVSCKYRDITKKFWQETNTEKSFYGLDDIKGASDIIIVEGEMDKLAMEEAGFKNCVSVPDGAPPKVSNKELPPAEEASRIILATDGDPPGQALAEELARRLGRERCWRVKWPKKNDAESFKDANERTSQAIAKEVGITYGRTEVMPTGKANAILSFEKGGKIVEEREINVMLIQPGDAFKVILDSKMHVVEYTVENQIEEDENENGSPIDEKQNFEKELRSENMIPGEDAIYHYEEEHNGTCAILHYLLNPRMIRNKVIGTIGDGYLSNNRVTDEYMDLDQ
ncbi:unnamed protein product [Fraxinus pennsylvanica]|uniref:Toprim domain-containing protein n=1 Tax=Fraxinus pennsylvanica TaxID=56036 RepID=A0AAD1YZI6_9LAMI|nr:unnamed protein product [Fraxinus pennsylvanica]